MAAKKVKTVEITVRVKVPKGMSAKETRRLVADQWYGTIDLSLLETMRHDIETLSPRWCKARVVPAAEIGHKL